MGVSYFYSLLLLGYGQDGWVGVCVVVSIYRCLSFHFYFYFLFPCVRVHFLLKMEEGRSL